MLRKWLAALLVLCLLMAAPAALSEPVPYENAGEITAESAEAPGEETGDIELFAQADEVVSKEAEEIQMEAPAAQAEGADAPALLEDGDVLELTEKATVPVVDITKVTTYEMGVGDSFQISTPGKTVIVYRSSKSDVATVASGRVRALSAGQTVVTAMVTGGKKFAMTVTVNSVDVPPTSVRILQPASKQLDVSSTLTLECVVLPEKAVPDVMWSSSNPGIATVREGVVTPNTTGKVTISVTTIYGSKTDSVDLTIVDGTMPTGIRIVKPSSLVRALSSGGVQLSYVLSPETARSGVNWGSSNSKVASVSASGYVTFYRAGTVTISATARRNGMSDKVRLTISDDITPTSIKLNPSKKYTMGLKDTLKIGYTILPASASSGGITWSSNYPKVASVDAYGNVTPKHTGTATITAVTKRGKRRASVTIKVVDYHAPASVSIKQKSPLRIKVGQTFNLSATVKGAYKNYSPRVNLTWTTANASYVKVTSASKGTIKGMKPGWAMVTVTTDNGKKDKIKVIVSK